LTTYKPKLIEVALPLAAINAEAAREKSIRHGHPSTLHLWWARRPLAATRAVIWSSLVDDPSSDDTLTDEQQEKERQRLFGILERLVKWENSNNPDVLREATAEIDRCFPDGPPPILDPFGGGGAIPLEAQRLGLAALSGDLNPVSVLIQKAMIEIPPRFAGHPPAHPSRRRRRALWSGLEGLAEDLEEYGEWMRDQVLERVGHLYPTASDEDGSALLPIAWIWARTVESPDPMWKGHVPLVSSWFLSKRAGKPTVWIEPVVNRDAQHITYTIRTGGEPTIDRTVKRGVGVCVATGATITAEYIKSEAAAGRMGAHLMAVVVERGRTRDYVAATEHDQAAAECPVPENRPIGQMADHPQYMGTPRYGLDEWWKLFTPRQLTLLNAYLATLSEVRGMVLADARDAGYEGDIRLRDGGSGAGAYADAVVTYLALALSRLVDMCNALCGWETSRTQVRHVFTRQAIPMVWDYAENNPFNDAGGDFRTSLRSVIRAVSMLPSEGGGQVEQIDALALARSTTGHLVSTDPPYYDAVPYSDISDFFYVWLRPALSEVWPDEFATILTPKAAELVADSRRFGSRDGAREHFEDGMAAFMKAATDASYPDAPLTVYYAYKTSESGGSTGWATFLQSVIDAGLQVNATWPLRTELANRIRGLGSNALASSIVLACRRRDLSEPMATRAEFMAGLRRELPDAIRLLQSGNIAPVDLAQSTIGPGIKVFSRYSKVVEANGSSMLVSDALAIINDVLGEVLDGEEAELDRDTRFAVTWYTQNGYNSGRSGDADAQARAKNTSLSGIEDSGVGEARGGKFRLFERSELDPDWDPVDDDRRTVWESTQYLVAALERSETEAADLLHRMGGYADRARQLAYVLFQRATEKGWAEEAGAYNGLITAWPSLQAIGGSGDDQQSLL
jgi:putative DNA methylase